MTNPEFNYAFSKNLKGFTLIEILVVLALITLILAIIPPMFSNVIDSTQIKSSSRLLVASLKEARSLAITKQKETTLMLDVEKKQFLLNQKQHNLNIPDNTKLQLIAANTEQLNEQLAGIRFFPDGSSTGGRIELSNNNLEYIIDVNWLTGKIQISP